MYFLFQVAIFNLEKKFGIMNWADFLNLFIQNVLNRKSFNRINDKCFLVFLQVMIHYIYKFMHMYCSSVIYFIFTLCLF